MTAPGASSGLAVVLAAVALAAAGAGRASAERRPRVVLVAAGADGASRSLVERLSAELDTMGFEPRSVPAPSGSLEAVAERQGADAAVEIATGDGEVRLTLHDRRSGRTEVRGLGAPVAPAAQAIQIAEVLRAWLLEAPPPPAVPSPPLSAERPAREEAPAHTQAKAPASTPAPAPERAPPPVSTPAQARAQARTEAQPPVPTNVRAPVAGAEFGLGALGSAGGLPPVAALALAAGVFASPRVRVGALWLVPLSSMRHQSAEGTSQTRATILALDVRGELRGQSWRASLGAGATAAVLSSEGRSASALYADGNATRVTPGAYVRPGMTYAFTRELLLRGELAVGWQPRPFAITYGGREAARWGAPWLASWISVETRFP